MATAPPSFKTPKQIYEAVCNVGKVKAEMPWHKIFVSGIFAGAYIAVGGFLAIRLAAFFDASSQLGFQKFIFPAVFPIGLILVTMIGAELFTGNCCFLPAAWLTKKEVKWWQWAKNWIMSYLGNFVGSVIMAYFFAHLTGLCGGAQGIMAKGLVAAKYSPTWGQLFLRGVGCNWLVNLAIHLQVAANDIGSKIAACWWPIMTFVALGFEHSVANMFFIPLGIFSGSEEGWGKLFYHNLTAVTLGNIVGAFILFAHQYMHSVPLWTTKEKQDKAKAEKEAKEKEMKELTPPATTVVPVAPATPAPSTPAPTVASPAPSAEAPLLPSAPAVAPPTLN